MSHTVEELLTIARSDLDDPLIAGADTHCRWKNDDLAGYLDRAQREGCLRSELIIDSTTASVCEIAVTAGTREYATDPSIVWIKRAKFEGERYPLTQETTGRLDETDPNWHERVGLPQAFVTDQDEGKLILAREPIEDYTLRLTVQRTPLVAVTWADRANALEVQHSEILLLEWVYHLAYARHDEDTHNDERSRMHEQRFASFFGPPLTAQRLAHKRRQSRAKRTRPHWF